MKSIEFSEDIKNKIKKGVISSSRVKKFEGLVERIQNELLPHPVITQNPYTPWFATTDLTVEDVRHFLVQFSVFSNLFIEAQLKKTINAPTLEAMHASKEILMNELGVVFRNPKKNKVETLLRDSDDALVEQEGTIEGGNFRFAAAHFEWLLRMVSHLGLTFDDVGKRKHGTKSTLFFCDELSRLYGSEDPHIALGASFSVENWAAAGFWKELISGLTHFKNNHCPNLPLGFFTWHDMIEDQHKAHTWEELEEDYFSSDLDEDKFILGGYEMLNGVYAFWKGLNSDRLTQNYPIK